MYEVKRFRQLLEAKLGNVKPLLTEQDISNPSTIGEYPKCVQDKGEIVSKPFSNMDYAIKGTGDWDGYMFGTDIYYKDGKAFNYYCEGNHPVTGKKGSLTVGKKPGVIDSDTDSSVVSNGEKVIKMGSRGPLVKELQNLLVISTFGGDEVGGAGCGDDLSKCDGKFGEGTYNAVLKMQDTYGYEPDGIIGGESVGFLTNTRLKKKEVEPAAVVHHPLPLQPQKDYISPGGGHFKI